LTFAICCLIPDDGGPSFLWGTWLALGYVGLRIESLWGMFYPSAVALVRIWRFDADGVAVNEYFMLILVMFFAYFIGKMLAWKELAAQFKQNKLRYEEVSMSSTCEKRMRSPVEYTILWPVTWHTWQFCWIV
jgi:hypothetical protein